MNQESRANLLPEKDQNPEKDGRHETGVSKEMDVINLDFSTNPTSKTGRAPMSSKTSIRSWSERELVLHSSGVTDENDLGTANPHHYCIMTNLFHIITRAVSVNTVHSPQYILNPTKIGSATVGTRDK